MKLSTTTLRLYIDNQWTDTMTINDFLRRHKDNTQIQRIYITESVSRKEALEILKEFEN